MLRTSLFSLSILISVTSAHSGNVVVTKFDTGWKFRQHNIGQWLDAFVPGTVHTDLLANDLIEDPFYRTNERDQQWIDKLDWEYMTEFDMPKEQVRDRMELVFDGLDTYAEVYLNGEKILTTDNMFMRYRVDVLQKTLPRGNCLRIVFTSPVKIGLERLTDYGIALKANNDNAEMGGLGGVKTAPFHRKAGYHHGWDWGPRFVTSGIWRDVRLEGWNEVRLDDPYVYTTSISNKESTMGAEITVDVVKAGDYDITVCLDGKRYVKSTRYLEAGLNTIKENFKVASPKLWYPNGIGEPYLYRTRIEVLNSAGEIAACKEFETGIRTVRLVQTDDVDGKGRSFGFEVNGRMLFMKGANWIPNDNFLPRITPEYMDHIVSSARDANMNMLRVWGGGVYEDELFYRLCDRYGILVWQDFMFACSNLPGTPEFLESVREEAIDNVKRLRSHPSIAIWCGNNEIEIIWRPWNQSGKLGMKGGYPKEQADILNKAYIELFHSLLPQVVKDYTYENVYWHSSPSPGEGIPWGSVPQTHYGDVHNWRVWHGLEPFEYYDQNPPRFASEYGFQSFPEFATVKQYTVPEDWEIESPVMLAHQRSKIGNSAIIDYMERYYNVPERFEDKLYLGQVLQAEGIKTGIEAHRRNMPWCMGSLYWQINDCWPVASWSSIDSYGRWKALHYFAVKAFENVIAAPYIHGDTLDIFVVSDLDRPVKGKMRLTLIDFNGNILFKQQISVNAAANTSTLIRSYNTTDILAGADPRKVVLLCELESKVANYTTLKYFDMVKNLELPKAKVDIKAARQPDGTCLITLRSEMLVKNIAIYYEGVAGIFSDNYFDMLPGRTYGVTLKTDEPIVEVLAALTCTSINNLYGN